MWVLYQFLAHRQPVVAGISEVDERLTQGQLYPFCSSAEESVLICSEPNFICIVTKMADQYLNVESCVRV